MQLRCNRIMEGRGERGEGRGERERVTNGTVERRVISSPFPIGAINLVPFTDHSLPCRRAASLDSWPRGCCSALRGALPGVFSRAADSNSRPYKSPPFPTSRRACPISPTLSPFSPAFVPIAHASAYRYTKPARNFFSCASIRLPLAPAMAAKKDSGAAPKKAAAPATHAPYKGRSYPTRALSRSHRSGPIMFSSFR